MNCALAAAIATWIQVVGGSWTPTSELAAIQTELKSFVEASAKRENKVLPKWGTYTFQYQGRGEASKRFVFINAFCSKPPADVKKQMVVVLDGGACFFNVKYDQQRRFLFDHPFKCETKQVAKHRVHADAPGYAVFTHRHHCGAPYNFTLGDREHEPPRCASS